MITVFRKRLSFQANKLSLAIKSRLSTTPYATHELAAAITAHATLIDRQTKLRLFMLRRLSTYANPAMVVLWTTLVRLPWRGPEPVQHQVEPVRLTIEDHWRRATGIIAAAIASFQRVQTFQAAAARQIDAADYALQHLLKDLCVAMPIPADGSALRAILATAGDGATTPADEALAA